jgi:hypothetical protein
MKLKDFFVTRQFQDTYVMAGTEDAEFRGIVNGNTTTAFIIESLKTHTTREEIIDKMLLKYDAPEEFIAEDVDKVLEVLKEIGAIEE